MIWKVAGGIRQLPACNETSDNVLNLKKSESPVKVTSVRAFLKPQVH